MKKVLRIGNASAFWGDSPQAPATLIKQQPDLDYLTLDYLAEMSLSIMAIQQEKDPTLGYARDFLDVVQSVLPFWKKGQRFKIVTNAGGLNPLSCAHACQHILKGLNLKIAVVLGDDVLSQLSTSENPLFDHMDTQESLSHVRSKLVTANAYLGAKQITEALLNGADIVITGRVTDPSLTVGPCMAHFGWSWSDYHRLAQATVAGHLIECGTQVTGGIATDWLNIPDPAHLGYPFVEVEEDGAFTITKPKGTGGLISQSTVKEQLLYEIGDPDNYLSPDVNVSFLNMELLEQGQDRVRITGAMGKSPTDLYKVSACYRAGYKAEGTLVIFGQKVEEKARLCADIILEHVRIAGYTLAQTHVECLGINGVAKSIVPPGVSLECVLRIAVSDPRQEAVECFSKEIAALVTCGPQGTTGYMSGRPHVRPVFGYWPCLIPKNAVKPSTQFLEVL